MIIQCEKCRTRFRLNDSRVTDKGVKVRCTKCKHVFAVRREEPEAESSEPELGASDFSFPVAQNEAPTAAPDDQLFATESVPEAPFASATLEGTSLGSEPVDFSSFETSDFDASAISFETDERGGTGSEDAPAAAFEPAAGGDEVDFSGFDFGDSDSEPDATPLATMSVDDFTDEGTEPAAVAPEIEAPQGLDFSDDDMFGAVVQTAPEVSSETISFDFEGDSFAESMDMNVQDSSGKRGTFLSLDTPGDAPFNLGEIDFGDELTSVAVQQVNPEDLKPSQEILFAPLAEARVKSPDDALMRSFPGEDSGEQDLPPLSITSRRKQNSLFGVLIAVISLMVLSVVGYLAYSSFSTPAGNADLESGKIGVRAVTAAYIENDGAGDLLVISGEALNEYPEPRAALQVKVTVFDDAGQSIATKSAYGGNPLTEEQLESLPLDKIEAAMANQFGDSLANMEVAPGKAIPFVIVLANLPEGAKDFSVQSAGSTVATGKQE